MESSHDDRVRRKLAVEGVRSQRLSGKTVRYRDVDVQLSTLPSTRGDIPGLPWTPVGAAGDSALILMGHGGGQHKKAPGSPSVPTASP